ncbi:MULTISPECIES: PP2C family protein-serine/threonine phosphatase [Gordonia]|uniref:Serine phosphatase n=2 Tax=Gordonia alkanivorans TaxID=84096 RepID=W9DHN3_9ACTN|nr:MULTISPECIES: SpoIIE family protein phosphatase [Gordonia]ETA08007.1 serine phosphatase [Gordonia alkanivorans CGMCC 6845]MDH3009576.1 SpoIIE family protein phosphatase [Gordonia alkanivorans]MDH3014019.1 SpoIIE family protein phosphatase [Gordonia alkanivorans]MDH3018877.1 SpoIIE family protein phosphatase [Gordonia alkanivorans]MDH3025459.1 SpoIIE family protein phosphatase [Gordonia alkanivorans]
MTEAESERPGRVTVDETQALIAPDVEEARLRAVEQLNLLDSAPEDRFAQITRMAKAVFGVPMSTVSLLDRDRQWFKAVDGIELQNQPREQTVCQVTVARAYTRPADPALVIEDVSTIPFFAEIPQISGEGGIRFYAGYPLYGPGGHPVGTFCVYDTRPRQLTADQLAAFRELAAWAQREIENSDDLERAAKVQRQLLPPPLGIVPGYSIETMCLPAFAVGGDFYDHYPCHDGLVFTVADVMGKGLGAAILTATVRSAMRAASRAFDATGGESADHDLGEVVGTVAGQLAEDFAGTETFATLFHARLRTRDGHVDYVDGGHGLATVRRADGHCTVLHGGGLPIGILPEDTWRSAAIDLGPGDMLVIASDGLLDLVAGGDALDLLRMLCGTSTPAAVRTKVEELVASLPPVDDVTLVAIRRDDAG